MKNFQLNLRVFVKIVVITMFFLSWFSCFPFLVQATWPTEVPKEDYEWCRDGLMSDWSRCVSFDDFWIDSGESETVEEFAGKLVDYWAGVISFVAIVGVMIGGVILMTAYGRDEQLQKGKSVILYSLLGLIFTLTSYLIVNFIQSILYSIE